MGTFERVTLPPGEPLWGGGGSGPTFMSYFAAGPRQGPPDPPGLVAFQPSFVFPLCAFRSFLVSPSGSALKGR